MNQKCRNREKQIFNFEQHENYNYLIYDIQVVSPYFALANVING